MLKAILIDDENIALKELTCLLSELEEVEIIGSFSDPFEGFFHIDLLQPDVIFLDIDMPQINGIYLAEQIFKKQKNIHIVFVTAFNDYAIQAFELNAIDYLLKPTSLERLQ
ncbi:MAG: response regulator [Marinisporobacter sp.]|jgi:two-component SAPR family response regulator|nr:response regulator [Marinisporobacter sp.]